MGRDNHPRARQKQKLERKKAKRASYDRILIVCEGEKTEPQYFEEIRQFHRLQTANVVILPSSYGTSPQQVVNFARYKLNESLEWEQVFCVFDRDVHPNFDNALKSAAALDRKFNNEVGEPIRFFAIPSDPCFELWLLLHFYCITHEIDRKKIIQMLRKDYLPNYEKSQKGCFLLTHSRLPTAFKNAKVLTKNRNSNKNENPHTAVGDLVKILTELSNR